MMRKVIILNHSLWYIRKEENLKVKIKQIKVTQKELAEYLGVDSSAITHYKNNVVGKRKVFLMIKGLQKIKEEKNIS